MSSNSKVTRSNKPNEPASPLKRGWTTGACATAATKAALTALITKEFPDPIKITLPKGEQPSFAICTQKLEANSASVGIIKDAGDDPDVTHGAQIISTVAHGRKNTGIVFKAGNGVGTVTKSGLPIGVGEPAINPIPRKMMRGEIEALCETHSIAPDFEITISVPEGEALAKQTWNPRLGILGGISILGTTGIVHPFSCSAWIHSIHRGIDVSRANNIKHVLGATGSTSENGADKIYNFTDAAMLDMGDFAGGLLKYLKNNPIENLTLAGGFAKFTKLAQGALDLHSGRSQVDLDWLAKEAKQLGLDNNAVYQIKNTNTAMEALQIATQQMPKDKTPLEHHIANLARQTALNILQTKDHKNEINVEVMIFSRDGKMLARVGELNL